MDLSKEEMKTALKAYADRMKKIRLLSTPDLSQADSPTTYSHMLVQNFTEIGELAQLNRQVLDTYIFPIVESSAPLTIEEIEILNSFNESLMKSDMFYENDVNLSDYIQNRLFQDEMQLENTSDDSIVLLLSKKIKRDYYFVTNLARYNNIDVDGVRDEAMADAAQLLAYLDRSKFMELSEESRGLVLQYSLMCCLLYIDTVSSLPDEYFEKQLSIVDRAVEILNDPFFRNAIPNYDWESYEFRIYYYASYIQYSNISTKIALRVYEYSRKLVNFLSQCRNEAILKAISIKEAKDLLDQVSVIAGIIPAREACDKIYKEYMKRNPHDYTSDGLTANLEMPSTYLNVVRLTDLKLTEKDYKRFRNISNSMLNYLYCIPKKGSTYMRCITLFSNLIHDYKELPGCMTMAELCVNAFTALHPPTSVHSRMVARLSTVFTEYLLDKHPELFVGSFGVESIEDITCNPSGSKDGGKRAEIIDYIVNASMIHDIGKLFIIDTVSMCGRNLLDKEIRIIKMHATIGADFAKQFDSTRPYSDVIRGHHIWFDGSNGYPTGFDIKSSPYRIAIDIIHVADCLDSATDITGRSYNPGKTLEEFRQELADGIGTQYATYFEDILNYPEIWNEINHILDCDRETLYKENYDILKKMHDRMTSCGQQRI